MTTTFWIDPSQLELTFQIHDLGYETLITSYKANKNKLWSSIPNKSIVEWWNYETFNIKNDTIKQLKSI